MYNYYFDRSLDQWAAPKKQSVTVYHPCSEQTWQNAAIRRYPVSQVKKFAEIAADEFGEHRLLNICPECLFVEAADPIPLVLSLEVSSAI